MPTELRSILFTLAIIGALTLIFRDIAWGVKLAVVITTVQLVFWGLMKLKENRTKK